VPSGELSRLFILLRFIRLAPGAVEFREPLSRFGELDLLRQEAGFLRLVGSEQELFGLCKTVLPGQAFA
jgi:hypothetical protein